MAEMTEEYVLNVLFRDVERVIQTGVQTKKDLEAYKAVFAPEYSWRDKDSAARRISDTIWYARHLSSPYYSSRDRDSTVYKNFHEEDYPILMKFIRGEYCTDSRTEEEKQFVINFLNNTTYVDEKYCSIFDRFYGEDRKYFPKETVHKIIEYHLKKKHSKTMFSSLLYQGILNEENMTAIKLTDKQLTELVFTEFKNLTKKNIRISDITALKRLRAIKSLFTDTVILEIVSKFIKEAENNKSSPDTIEVILSMFFHYLDLDFDDYPDAQLLLAISINKEIDI